MSDVTITKQDVLALLDTIAQITEVFNNLASVSDVTLPEVVPVVPVAPVVDAGNAFSHNGINFYKNADLAGAKSGFTATYGTVPVDNDRVGGIWYSGDKQFDASDLPNGINASETTPVTATASNGSITLNTHDGVVDGSDWKKTDLGLEWNGPNRYKENSDIESGTVTFSVDLDAGDYVIELRGRAAELTSGRTDLHNDAWIKIDGVFGWRKHYFSGKGGWATSKTAEIGGSHATNAFKITKAGTYSLVMSGRSDHAEIATITLKG